jgi:hypothetical protein
MKTRPARARPLSRSGQPRRRLARRRQQLPTPVLHAQRVVRAISRTGTETVQGLFVAPTHGEVLESIVVSALHDLEIGTVPSS